MTNHKLHIAHVDLAMIFVGTHFTIQSVPHATMYENANQLHNKAAFLLSHPLQKKRGGLKGISILKQGEPLYPFNVFKGSPGVPSTFYKFIPIV